MDKRNNETLAIADTVIFNVYYYSLSIARLV